MQLQTIKFMMMKYLFFIIAALLLLTAAILFWGFRPFGTIHILFLVALFFVGIGVIYNNSKKKSKIDKA